MRLPIFCVGSKDYLNLKSATDPAVVFTDANQTGIPELIAHLLRTGECRRLKWAANLLARARAFSAGIETYFSEGKHPGRLPLENKEQALAMITELERVGIVLVAVPFI